MANNALAKFKKFQAVARAALTGQDDLMRDEQHLSRLQKFLHFCLLVSKSFVRNRCPVRASALAYASLLALVPMLAVVISVTSSLLKNEGEERIGRFIEQFVKNVTPETGDATEALQSTKAVATRKEITRRINEFIQNIRSGTLGATGMVALLFMAITMLSRIEDTFNDIWGVTRGRSWFARIVLYWAALTLGPLLLLSALALTSGPHLQATKDFLAGLPLGAGNLIVFGFKFLPFLILSLAFGAFYGLMPNTKVHWRAALIGGIVGGCLWQLNNIFSVFYVSRVVTYSKIYGSIGIVPVFMIGLYVSWIILLFGAQVAYAVQNRRTYFQEKQVESVSQSEREFIALRVMTLVALAFHRGDRPPTTAEIAQALAVPTKLVSQILKTLLKSKLVVEVMNAEPGHAPARSLDKITCHDILHALRIGQGPELVTSDDAMRTLLHGEFEKIQQAEQQVAAAVTLQKLVTMGDFSEHKTTV